MNVNIQKLFDEALEKASNYITQLSEEEFKEKLNQSKNGDIALTLNEIYTLLSNQNYEVNFFESQKETFDNKMKILEIVTYSICVAANDDSYWYKNDLLAA